jgi:hypothetical protein
MVSGKERIPVEILRKKVSCRPNARHKWKKSKAGVVYLPSKYIGYKVKIQVYR